MRCLVIGALALLAFPLAAQSQDWVPYGTSPQGDHGFVDRASLKIAGSTRTIWTRLDKAVPAAYQGNPLQNWMALVQVDCSARTHRSVAEAGYRPDGTLLYDTRFEGPTRPVVARTMGEIRLDVICGLGDGAQGAN